MRCVEGDSNTPVLTALDKGLDGSSQKTTNVRVAMLHLYICGIDGSWGTLLIVGRGRCCQWRLMTIKKRPKSGSVDLCVTIQVQYR